MEAFNHFWKKLLANVKKYYGSKETWKDSVLIGSILFLMTFLPSFYYRISISKWRVSMVLFLWCICLMLFIFMVYRLLKRNLEQKPGKSDWFQFFLRILILCLILAITVVLQVKISYPAFSGIADIQLSGGKKIVICIIQSIVFSFYSQALVSACMRIRESVREWVVRLAMSCYKTIWLLALLTLLTVLWIQAVAQFSPILARGFSVVFTTLLWITAIVIQEREKYEDLQEKR